MFIIIPPTRYLPAESQSRLLGYIELDIVVVCFRRKSAGLISCGVKTAFIIIPPRVLTFGRVYKS